MQLGSRICTPVRKFFMDRNASAVLREAYSTPVFRKTKCRSRSDSEWSRSQRFSVVFLPRRNDLAEKWDNLGFSIRPLNGHVRCLVQNCGTVFKMDSLGFRLLEIFGEVYLVRR